MKKIGLLVSFCLFGYLLQAQLITLNPQIGINSSRLSTDPAYAEATARVGYLLGADVRIGKKWFLEPGVFWYRVGTDLLTEDQITAQPLADQVILNYVKVPLCVGTRIIDTDPFKFRGSAGLVTSFYTGIRDNIVNLNNRDFNSLVLGLRVGFGIDLLFLTFDLDYEAGLGNALATNEGARNDVLSLAVGFKL